jgi:MFS transporter
MSTATALPAETSPDAAPAPRHPIFLRHFRNLWIGATISLLGDQFYLVALPWLVLQLTSSGLVLGTVLMIAAIPRALLMLVGGAVTDRVSARRVLLTTAAVRTVLVGAVAALIWLHVIQLWHLYLLTLAFGIADAFSLPAGPALIPTLVEPQQLRPANALLQSSAVTTQMAGPALAGLLVKSWGIASALFFDALTFLAVIAALFRIPEPPKAPAPDAAAARPGMLHAIGGMLHAIGEGLRVVSDDPPLLALMLLYGVLNFCVAGSIYVGLAATAKFRFESAAAFGSFLAFFSGGMLLGSVLGGLVRQPRKRGPQFIAVSALAGLELIAIGLAPKFAVIAAALALMGVGIGWVGVQFSAWIQLRVDRAVLGRVMSVLMFALVGFAPVSYGLFGVLAKWHLPAVFLTAGALLLSSSGLALTSKAARAID